MPATVTRLEDVKIRMEKTTITPQIATSLLENNTINRPLSDAHVHRIARQITGGHWKFNGDTIKIADTKDVVDGQHRLWAVIEANMSIETIIVYGVARDAFSTLDTIRKPRSGSDVLALGGMERGKSTKFTAAALKLLFAYQHDPDLRNMGKIGNRAENSDIEALFVSHPNLPEAVGKVAALHSVAAVSALAFVYYIAVSKNENLAEQMITILDAPAGTSASNPFYQLRKALVAHEKKRRTVEQIALMFKALNIAKNGKKIDRLIWKCQGDKPEDFPVLRI